MSVLNIYSQNWSEKYLFSEVIVHKCLDAKDYHELILNMISEWSGHLPHIATSLKKWIYSYFSLWNNFMYTFFDGDENK